MTLLLLLFLITGGTITAFIGLVFWSRWYRAVVKKRIKKDEKKLKELYFKDVNEKNPLLIIDETPRELMIGDRIYILKPLKYRQFTRLCILLAQNLEKLKDQKIDLSKPELVIGQIVESSEEDFFKAAAIILYYSKNENQPDSMHSQGIHDEFVYLKDHATLNELSRLLEVVALQNDIQRALNAFGMVNDKKKIT